MKVIAYVLSIFAVFMAVGTACDMSKEFEARPSLAVAEAINRAVFIHGHDYLSTRFDIFTLLPKCSQDDNIVNAGRVKCVEVHNARRDLLSKSYRWYFVNRQPAVEIAKGLFYGKYHDTIIDAAGDPCAYLYKPRLEEPGDDTSIEGQDWVSVCGTDKYRFGGVIIYLMDGENVVGRTFVTLDHKSRKGS